MGGVVVDAAAAPVVVVVEAVAHTGHDVVGDSPREADEQTGSLIRQSQRQACGGVDGGVVRAGVGVFDVHVGLVVERIAGGAHRGPNVAMIRDHGGIAVGERDGTRVLQREQSRQVQPRDRRDGGADAVDVGVEVAGQQLAAARQQWNRLSGRFDIGGELLVLERHIEIAAGTQGQLGHDFILDEVLAGDKRGITKSADASVHFVFVVVLVDAVAIAARKRHARNRRGVEADGVVLPKDIGVGSAREGRRRVARFPFAEVDLLFGPFAFGVKRGEWNLGVAHSEGFFEAVLVRGAEDQRVRRVGRPVAGDGC